MYQQQQQVGLSEAGGKVRHGRRYGPPITVQIIASKSLHLSSS